MDRKTLRRHVECPVCLEIRKDVYYYQCENNHNICQICKEDVKMAITKCPIGQCSYNDTPLRNRQVEQLIADGNLEFSCKWEGCNVAAVGAILGLHEQDCQFRIINCTFLECNEKMCAMHIQKHISQSHIECRNSQSGCKFTGTNEAIKDHIDECIFRKTTCPAYNCKSKLMATGDILDHVNSVHKNEVRRKHLTKIGEIVVLDEILDEVQVNNSKINIIELDGNIFIARVFQNLKGHCSCWVWILGNQKKADEFVMKVTFCGNNTTVKKVCKVHPIDMSEEDIMESMESFQLSQRQLNQCIGMNAFPERSEQSGIPKHLLVQLSIARKQETNHESGEAVPRPRIPRNLSNGTNEHAPGSSNWSLIIICLLLFSVFVVRRNAEGSVEEAMTAKEVVFTEAATAMAEAERINPTAKEATIKAEAKAKEELMKEVAAAAKEEIEAMQETVKEAIMKAESEAKAKEEVIKEVAAATAEIEILQKTVKAATIKVETEAKAKEELIKEISAAKTEIGILQKTVKAATIKVETEAKAKEELMKEVAAAKAETGIFKNTVKEATIKVETEVKAKEELMKEAATARAEIGILQKTVKEATIKAEAEANAKAELMKEAAGAKTEIGILQKAVEEAIMKAEAEANAKKEVIKEAAATKAEIEAMQETVKEAIMKAEAEARAKENAIAAACNCKTLAVDTKYKVPKVTDIVWFDISIDSELIGRMEIGLFGEIVPKTVTNFIGLTKKPEGEGYKKSEFFIITKEALKGGLIGKFDGASIYGGYFDDENYALKHVGAGWLGMLRDASLEKNTNGAQFYITFKETPNNDGDNVVFAKIIKGMSVLRKIEAIDTNDKNQPLYRVIIEDCGHEPANDIVLYRRWPFGPDTQWLCQLANAGQTTPVFMSSLSIVAIALDRYRCIIQHDLRQVSVASSIMASVVMAGMAMVMSIPLFTGTQLRPYVSFNKTTMDDILVCSDDRSGTMRTVYRLSSTFVQFLLPLLLVMAVYVSIFARLQIRPQSQHSGNNRRRRRTNVMIVLISVTFFLSWLPLNVLNTVLDFTPDFIEKHLGGQDRLVYGICNILGLSNACVNPVLYGYLNENFRKEYKCIYQRIPWHRVSSVKRSSNQDGDFKYELNQLNGDVRRRREASMSEEEEEEEGQRIVKSSGIIFGYEGSRSLGDRRRMIQEEEEEMMAANGHCHNGTSDVKKENFNSRILRMKDAILSLFVAQKKLAEDEMSSRQLETSEGNNRKLLLPCGHFEEKCDLSETRFSDVESSSRENIAGNSHTRFKQHHPSENGILKNSIAEEKCCKQCSRKKEMRKPLPEKASKESFSFNPASAVRFIREEISQETENGSEEIARLNNGRDSLAASDSVARDEASQNAKCHGVICQATLVRVKMAQIPKYNSVMRTTDF